MYSRVLDDRTLAEVISAAPTWQEDEEALAREVLLHLAREMFEADGFRACEIVGTGAEMRFELEMKLLAGFIDSQPTPHRVGRAVSALGLKTRRTANGYLVVWNAKQVKILRSFLGV